MELLKLAGVFCVMILVLWRKKPLSWAVAAAALAVWLLFWMPARTFAAALVRGAVRWDTIQLLLVLYLITFLQRMLEKRGCLTSAKDALDGLFRIPLEDGWLVKASCGNGEFSLLPDSSLFDAVRMFSDSVFTPDGYIYFSIAAFAVEGEGTLRELSGALTPGGEWGVWRVKCTLAPGTDTSENRWWTKDGVYVTPDVSTLESVCGDHGTLGLSGDGKYVLLATEASGSLRLEVFDAASGERVQSLEPGVEPSMLSFHSGEGWVVLDCGGEVMALTQTDAGFETVLRCATDDSRLYALTRAMYYEDSGDYVYDGERIWRLEQALFDSERQYEYRRAYLLVGYGGEGMDYVELLTDAVTARHSDESLLWFGGDYGLDITEVGA